MDEMRALLDSLMGSDRNEPLKNRKSFKDPDVCHFYVLAFCPNDLFPNTKSDLGQCPNKHCDSFKTEFLSDPDHDYYQWKYEDEFIERLQRLISNVEIRIKRGNDRILGHDEQQIEKEKEKKLDAMREEASGILKLAEEAGEAGNIAEAEAQTAQANELRRKVEMIAGTPVMPISAQEKSLRVCEICSAMQSTGDAATRFESHVNGKQHKGYELIRATFAKLVEKHTNEKPPQSRFSSSFVGGSRREREKPDMRPSEQPAYASRVDSDRRRHSSKSKTRLSYSPDRYRRKSYEERRGDRSRRASRSPLASPRQPRHYDDRYDRHQWDNHRGSYQQHHNTNHRRSGNHHYDQRYNSNSYRRQEDTERRRKQRHFEKEPSNITDSEDQQQPRSASPPSHSSRHKERRSSYDIKEGKRRRSEVERSRSRDHQERDVTDKKEEEEGTRRASAVKND